MDRRRPDWNPDTSKRDPHIDPKPGDVLSFGPRRRIYVVSWLYVREGVVFYRHCTWRRRSCYLATTREWRRMMKHKDIAVERVAEVSQ